MNEENNYFIFVMFWVFLAFVLITLIYSILIFNIASYKIIQKEELKEMITK